jgi:mannose-6-phosphate isomerase
MSRLIRLSPSFREKIWGVNDLRPWFAPRPERIGEVWFLPPEPLPLPILVKFIYTSALLSVQVHPDDAYAKACGDLSGKTEMWYVLRADPGSKLAMGLKTKVTREQLRQAATSGEIENLLQWFPVTKDQVYFIPPGTLHALGAGIVVCEIQQNADITYRLYDYGRPRELHLEKALGVASLEPYPGPIMPEGSQLASCDYFIAERIRLEPNDRTVLRPRRCDLLIVLEGHGTASEAVVSSGDVWLLPETQQEVVITAGTPIVALRAFLPS